MPKKNIEERRAYHREYMRRRLSESAEFREKHYARVRRNDQNSRADIRAMIESFRINGCVVCGEMDHVCLSAHHTDPSSKDFNLGDAARGKYGRVSVRNELAKCICLCQNCHYKLHAGRIDASLIVAKIDDQLSIAI